jgi:hypothetical protein
MTYELPEHVQKTINEMVINNDEAEYRKILAARAAAKKNKELERRVEILEKELKQLKALVNGNR